MFVSAAHVAYLLTIAASLSGYSVPHDAQPVVEELTSAQMAQAACDGSFMGCGVIGFYQDGTDHVYVDAEYTNSALGGATDEDSVIVHELTHWLQDKHGKSGYDCPGMLVREYEAYKTQAKFIIRYEHKADPGLVVPMSTCGPVDPNT